jgi:hypothetical protein
MNIMMMMIENIEHALFECFQDLPACRCKSCMEMKMSIDHWWTDIDKAESHHSEKTPVSASTCPESHMEWSGIETGPL